MKFIKKLLLMFVVGAMTMSFAACGKEDEQKDSTNFTLKYNAKKQVDKVICEFEDLEELNIELSAMGDDSKVKDGYTYYIDMPENEEIKFSIKLIDEGKVVYEKINQKVNLTENKTSKITVVENKSGEFDVKIENK